MGGATTAMARALRFIQLVVLISEIVRGDKIDQFNAWFSKHAVSSKIQAADFGSGMGRGLVATEAVRRGDLVLSFPTSMSLRPRDLQDTSIAQYTQEAQVSQTDQLVLTLMCERWNPNSKFKEWIALLPKRYTSLITAQPSDLELLDDADLTSSVAQDRGKLEADFQKLETGVFARRRDVFPPKQYNRDNYLWARFMVDSRCWSLKGERLCVPGADFFNYGVSSEDQNDPDSRLLGNFFADTHKREITSGGTEVVLILSDRDCEAGEQLLEAYGESNNIFLAEWFGFVPDTNPSDVLRLKWLFKPGQGESHAEKLAMLNMFAGEIQVEFKLRMVSQLPSTVLHYLRLTTLSAAQAKRCSQVGSKQALVKCLSGHNSTAMFDELKSVVRKRLAEFSTTLEQDEKLLKDLGGKERNKRLAIQHRVHQKKIAHHVLALIKRAQTPPTSTNKHDSFKSEL